MTQDIGEHTPDRRYRAGQRLSRRPLASDLAPSLHLFGFVTFLLGLIAGAGIGISVPYLVDRVNRASGVVVYAEIAPPPPPAVASLASTPPSQVQKPQSGADNVRSVENTQLAQKPLMEPIRSETADIGGLATLVEPEEATAPTLTAHAIQPPLESAFPPDDPWITGSIQPSQSSAATESLPEPSGPALAGNMPQIALVIDDLGLSPLMVSRALQLPQAVTLSFLPYGRASAELAAQARQRGHQILLHLPMEPHGTSGPGPSALSTSMTAAEIAERTAAMLGAVGPVDGVNNHMGSRFTEDIRALIPVMKELKKKNLLFLDSKTSEKSRALAAAKTTGVTALARDIFLDHESGPDNMLMQLQKLERMARSHGYAVAIAHPHDLTLDVLDTWVKGLEGKGIQLIPLSQAVRAKNEKS